jgi:hypothetical protein
VREIRHRIAIVVVAVAAALGVAVAIAVANAPQRPPTTTRTPGSVRPATAEPGVATILSFRDFTILPGAPPEPPGRGIQSRLWSKDGTWSAAMVEPASRTTRIYELSGDAATWSDTGVVLDERPGAMVDAIWTAGRLYVASAVPGQSTSNGLRVSRFSIDADGRYVLDPNFPIRVTERGVGAASLARDTSGRLWAAFLQEGTVLVAHSADDEAVWTAPKPFPGGATVGESDVAALVADGSGRLALVWSSAPDHTVRFANRDDGDGPDRWFPIEVAFQDLPLADEPLSVAARDGSVFVAVETAMADQPNAGGTDPGSVVLARDPDGIWSSALLARVEDHLGQPLALIDAAAGQLYVFMVTPSHGGSLQLKRSELDRLEFPAGRGLAVISDASQPDIAFPTSTKDAIDLEDGFVVLGFDDKTGSYWHAIVGPPDGAVGQSPPPPSSSGNSLSVAPSPTVAGPTALFTDNFDPWPLDGPIGNGWELGPADAQGSITAVPDTAGTGSNAHLVPSGPTSIRACKSFAPASTGILVSEIRVRLDGIGTADAVIASLRDRSGEAVSVRFGQGGTFAYYSGAEKVRTTAPIRVGTWYRSVVTADLDGHTYDWRLTTDDGTVVVKVGGIPFREAAASQASEICVQTSAGAGNVGLRFDDVRVSR